MTETHRCEPPEHLRDRDGWHWLTANAHGSVLCRWMEHKGRSGDWRWHYAGSMNNDISDAAIKASGWRYLAPATPPAVAALVAALDFYACVDHYPVHHAVAPEVVRNDGGTKARAALAAYREGGR